MVNHFMFVALWYMLHLGAMAHIQQPPVPTRVMVYSYHNVGSSIITRLINLSQIYLGPQEALAMGE